MECAMARSTLGSKGQIVIPAAVRADLGVKAGNRIEFVKTDAGWLLKPAAGSVTSLKGVLRKPPRPISIEAMNQAVRARATR
jgi:AbrB family looped-hinge helix DNA binding protein